jgi:hypothetical protein
LSQQSSGVPSEPQIFIFYFSFDLYVPPLLKVQRSAQNIKCTFVPLPGDWDFSRTAVPGFTITVGKPGSAVSKTELHQHNLVDVPGICA